MKIVHNAAWMIFALILVGFLTISKRIDFNQPPQSAAQIHERAALQILAELQNATEGNYMTPNRASSPELKLFLLLHHLQTAGKCPASITRKAVNDAMAKNYLLWATAWQVLVSESDGSGTSKSEYVALARNCLAKAQDWAAGKMKYDLPPE